MYIYITWRFHPVDTGEVARWKFLAHYPRVSNRVRAKQERRKENGK